MLIDGDKDMVIADYLATPEGKRKLAASMVQPIRGVIPDYRPCPVCGEIVRDLVGHAASAGDDAHRVMEVMES